MKLGQSPDLCSPFLYDDDDDDVISGSVTDDMRRGEGPGAWAGLQVEVETPTEEGDCELTTVSVCEFGVFSVFRPGP